MIQIDLFDFYSSVKDNSDFQKKDFSKVKKELDSFHEHELILEALSKTSLFGDKTMHVSNDDVMQSHILISEIKEKKEIVEKLHGLADNIGLLRSTILTNDKEKTNKLIKDITSSEYMGISAIIADLNAFKTKMKQLEELHHTILAKDKSIDVHTNLEEEFNKKHSQLKEMHLQQKNSFLNLTHLFLEMTKSHLKK